MQVLRVSENERKVSNRVDPEFKHKLEKAYNGGTLRFCYQCGTCTANCPISRFIDTYRPNKILELAKLGIRGITSSNAVLWCSACTQCTKGCPQGVRVHEVMHALKGLMADDENALDHLSQGFEEILEALGEEIPFPVSYSLICFCPSEKEEGRSELDNIVMDALQCSLSRVKKTEKPNPKTGEKGIAIIGSGPAGLTAAWKLGREGYPVTVFESLPEPGGMLRVGIPNYRLRKDVVAAEIQQIEDLGVEIKTNTTVDQNMFESLLQGEKYKAIYIAAGSSANRKLRVEGESLEGVVPVLDLLSDYNLNVPLSAPKRVVVIGGGNVAIDAARSAIRCGAETVQLFCLESRAEMPSHEWEIQEAIDEGVVINPSWGVGKILGDGQKVTGVELIRCKSVFDENKKFNPQFDEKTTKEVEADMVISAIGQAPDLSFLGNKVDISRGVIVVDPQTMETSLPGVFAGGDNVSGAGSVIEAMVAGRLAADSIIDYLEGLD